MFKSSFPLIVHCQGVLSGVESSCGRGFCVHCTHCHTPRRAGFVVYKGLQFDLAAGLHLEVVHQHAKQSAATTVAVTSCVTRSAPDL
jgi:hypothetical protein